MNFVEEKSFFGEKIKNIEEFTIDLCERIDSVYRIVLELESKISQLACIIGFFRGFKGMLNRVCASFDSKFSGECRYNLKFEKEETFFGKKLNNSEEFLKDFRNRVDIIYVTAMEEEQVMPRLVYLMRALIGLKSRLNQVCGTV